MRGISWELVNILVLSAWVPVLEAQRVSGSFLCHSRLGENRLWRACVGWGRKPTHGRERMISPWSSGDISPDLWLQSLGTTRSLCWQLGPGFQSI